MRLVLWLFLLPIAVSAQFAVNTNWDLVTDAERNLSAPVVDKSAGVEAIFWKVHVLDDLLNGSTPHRVLYHYVRLKIFNQAGVEQAATIDIEYDERSTISAVAGRTIRRDGTILELSKDAIKQRDLVRIGAYRRRAKSFAMPGLEPGAIAEYRWNELIDVENMLYLKLQMQREFAIQRVTYFIRPLPADYINLRMVSMPFNCRPSPLKLENTNFQSTYLDNVPAFRREVLMPGEANVRAWLLLRYQDGTKRDPDKYWNEVGKNTYFELKQSLKPNDEIREAAEAAVAGAPASEKMVRLIQYVRRSFRNLYSPAVGEAERAAVLKQIPKHGWRSAPAIFKSKVGAPNELNALVIALAGAVGIEARPVRVATRDGLVFHRELAEEYFLPRIDIAALEDGKWRVYDVTPNGLPANMLMWQEEGMDALVSDPKKPEFVTVPLSPPESSGATRTAKLRLGADGTLEGDVEEVFTGHRAADERYNYEGESEARQQEMVKDEFLKLYPGAGISSVKVEHASDLDEPIRITYQVKIPGYGQVTGKRIFFQPLYFRRGMRPLFSSAERKYEVHFPYAWKDTDKVSIQLPQGYGLDSPQNPGPLTVGQVGRYGLDMRITPGGLLLCERTLMFGAANGTVFPTQHYPTLKAVFDEFHRRDGVTLSVRQTPGTVSSR